MKKIQYELVGNILTAEDFVRLKVANGFLDRPLDQVEKALKNGLFNVSAICNDQVVGMGRLVGDGAMYWYLQETIVQAVCIWDLILRMNVSYLRERGLQWLHGLPI